MPGLNRENANKNLEPKNVKLQTEELWHKRQTKKFQNQTQTETQGLKYRYGLQEHLGGGGDKNQTG